MTKLNEILLMRMKMNGKKSRDVKKRETLQQKLISKYELKGSTKARIYKNDIF